MKYEEAVANLLEIPKFAKKIGTENLNQLLEQMGHPEKRLRFIHVAGTNGKGSTCAFMEAMLMEAGYHVGMFTSPHLVKINERFRFDAEIMTDEAFLEIYGQITREIEQFVKRGFPYPSYFEVMFLFAVVWYEKLHADYVILETGLGGRLDATNLVHPLVSVITSVGMDHMEYLGDTIEQIAYEKAGIIKEGVPVVYFKRDEIASAVINKRANELHSDCIAVDSSYYDIVKFRDKAIDFLMDSTYYRTVKATIHTNAKYQVENAVLAAHVLAVLKERKDVQIEDSCVVAGLLKMFWPGRMEEVIPHVIVDGAHNEEAITSLVETLRMGYKDCKIHLLFAVAKDKEYDKMIQTLCSFDGFTKITVTTIPNDRRADVDEIGHLFQQDTDVTVTCYEEMATAYHAAVSGLGADEILLCVGSLYLVGGLKALIREEENRD